MKHPVLLTTRLTVAGPAAAGSCAPAAPGLKGLLDAEYAFAEAARSSVRQAFLSNLSDDSWVLEPTPTPGKPWYEASPESDARLEWYPHVADIAGSGELGFTTGPWTYSKDSMRTHGQFLTLWRLEPGCQWRVIFDGGISHPLADAAPPEKPGEAVERTSAPPAATEGGEAEAFQAVAGREGLAAALRTYARNGNFLLLDEGSPPMNLDQAERLNRRRLVPGPWRETAHGQSHDGSLRYVLGQVQRGSYVEIWQYDAKVANWGLRILMLTAP